MGTSTFVEQPNPTWQGAARQLRTVRQGLDFILVGVVVALTLFGLLMVYSAGPKFASYIKDAPSDYFLIRQMVWAGIGVVAILITTMFNYHYYQKITVLLMAGTLGALILVMVLGQVSFGSIRSLYEGSIRPSELAKLVTIIYVSVWLYSKREVLNNVTLGLLPLGFMLGAIAVLILVQPDLSAAITVLAIGSLLFFLGGAEWRQIVLMLVVAVFAGWIVINVFSTGRERVTAYISGLQNPLDASYHVRRSLEAVINGGFFGVGIGHSSTKFTGLPLAHTDSIFAIVAEEVGLAGVLALIGAYLTILWRGLVIAKNAPDMLGRTMAAGITIWIVLEAFINMAVMVNLLPHAGNALPFISYGGSNLLVTLTGIGILLNIGRTTEMNKQHGGNTFASVVNLRGRDRRGSVSRNGRP